MPAIEIIGAAAWLAAVVAGAAATGALAADIRGGDRLDRWFTGVFVAIAEVLTASVVLASAGLYSRGWLLAFQVATGAVAMVGAFRRGRGAAAETVPVAPESRLGARHAVAAITAGFVVLSLGVGLAAGRSQHFESLHYHFAGVAHLVTTHSLWELPFQNPAFFTATHPHNAELLYGVVALATGGDELIYLAGLPVFAVLIVLAGAVIAREAANAAALGALAVLAVVSTPIVFGTQARSIASDLPAAAFVVAAAAFFISDRKMLTTLLAGVGLGAAIGTKYTVVVPVAVMVLAGLVRFGLRRALWLLPGLLVLGAPWFARNWLETGNPVYPQQVAVGGAVLFEGGTTPLEPLSNTFASHVAHRRSEAVRTWGNFVGDFYGPVAAVAVAGAAAGLVARRRDLPAWPRRSLGGLAVVSGAAYAVTPYTGAGVPPLEFLMGSNLRYALLAISAGALAAAVGFGRRVAAVLLAVPLIWSLWQLVANPIREDVRMEAVLLAAATLAAVAVPLLAVVGPRVPVPRLQLPRGTFAVAWTSAVVLAITVVALAGPRGEGDPPPLEASLDSVLPEGRVVAVGVDDLRSVVGVNFARVPVAVTPGPVYASTPFASAEALARALDKQPVDVAVVGLAAHPGVPAGFKPSSAWCQVADVSGVTVYERGRRPCR